MFSIAEISAKTGLSASTIRYYEEQGLLNQKPFRKAGRRYFDRGHMAELALLNDLRRAGMTLSDIKHFQSLRVSNAAPCSELSSLAHARAMKLRAEIMELRKAEARLSAFADSCSVVCGTGPASNCGELGSMKT